MILAIGEILFDVFPDYRRLGGAPFNFAFHLKQLGFPVRFVSRVGEDHNGKEIRAAVKAFGFNPADLQIDSRHATGTVDVTLNNTGTRPAAGRELGTGTRCGYRRPDQVCHRAGRESQSTAGSRVRGSVHPPAGRQEVFR
jgi:sugar/nucleoside kinase (ribokinase family)